MSGRWGSFLQQAVAGVESRLDTILAEGQEESNSTASTKKVEEKPKETLKPESVSRSASGNRANDRLQERLARAVAAKNAAQKGKVDGTANKSVSTPPRTGSPALKDESPRTSVDTAPPVMPPMAIPTEEKAPADLTEEVAEPALASRDTPSIEVQNTSEGKTGKDAEQDTGAPTAQVQKEKKETEQGPTGLLAQADEGTARLSVDSARSSLPRDSIDSNRPTVPGSRSSLDIPAALVSDITADQKDPADYEALLKQVQSDFEASELQRQEEIHDYVERIDALQAKLQYLAKESAEAAKKASNAAASGSVEKKLADKDEQVALLMEEGQKLSKKELTHLSTIKKLRARIQQDNKELMDAKSKQEKAEKDVAFANERLKRAESSEKRVNEKQRQINQLQKDIESLKSERDSKDSTIASLKRQLDDAAAEEKKAEVKATNEALVAERRKVADLEDDVANLKIEKNLLADRLQGQIKELREKIDKDAERSRMLELEMKSEQQNLESKLEVMRARAEEVTTGATGDAQAKLLRQIETLQTQYAVASENWQGIEASLIARAASLEKERDEATRREADIRKKAREVTLKAKRNEDELEESRSRLPSFQEELANHKSQLESLQKRAEEAESALVEAQQKFEQEKQSWASDLLQRIDEERQKWQEEAAIHGSHGNSRAHSPVASSRRGLTSEYLGLQNLQLRRASARSVNSDVPTVDRLLNRRPSAQPLRSSGQNTPMRQDSSQSITTNGDVPILPGTPFINTDKDDDFFDEPGSPHHTLNDLVSTSTVAAGPSVQFVERMSSTIRHLESEKVATKEDIARLSAQRDEARKRIVDLMREVKEKRDVEEKVKEVQKEVEEIRGRYDAALEMLGEKSEQLDEAKSDIDDLKAMYRELVLERTGK